MKKQPIYDEQRVAAYIQDAINSHQNELKTTDSFIEVPAPDGVRINADLTGDLRKQFDKAGYYLVVSTTDGNPPELAIMKIK